jgi:hypothetical protein
MDATMSGGVQNQALNLAAEADRTARSVKATAPAARGCCSTNGCAADATNGCANQRAFSAACGNSANQCAGACTQKTTANSAIRRVVGLATCQCQSQYCDSCEFLHLSLHFCQNAALRLNAK